MNRFDTKHRNTNPLSYDNLIAAIEELEAKKIISFDEFEKLPIHQIKAQYFAMPHETQLMKAIVKIRDLRNGIETSKFTQIVTEHKDGETKVTKKTSWL